MPILLLNQKCIFSSCSLTWIEMFCLFLVDSNTTYRQKQQHTDSLCIKRSDNTQQVDDLYWKYLPIQSLVFDRNIKSLINVIKALKNIGLICSHKLDAFQQRCYFLRLNFKVWGALFQHWRCGDDRVCIVFDYFSILYFSNVSIFFPFVILLTCPGAMSGKSVNLTSLLVLYKVNVICALSPFKKIK